MNKATRLIFAACSLSAVTLSSQACQFHEAPMFGAFSMKHLMNQQNNQGPATLILTHDRSLSATVNETASINIDYKMPVNFRNTTLEFSSDDGVTLQEQGKVPLRKLNGSYALSYVATTAGEHVINITAKATKDGYPFSRVQKIRLMVQ